MEMNNINMSRSRQGYSIHNAAPTESTNSSLPSNFEHRLANFYIAVLLEGIGVLLLVFIGGSVYIKLGLKNHDFILEVAIVYGASLAILTHFLKDITESHLNPAITMACFITRRVSILRGIAYILFQLIGSIVGDFMLHATISTAQNTMTQLSSNLSVVIGVVYEMIFTFMYTILYFSLSSRKSKSAFKHGHAPLALGMFYGVSHIVLIDRTGCSLNPARSFGPAVVNNDYRNLWVYFACPILASCLGVLIHDLVLKKSKRHSYPRARSLSLICCKPSREELILREHQSGYQSDYTMQKMEDVV